MDKITALAAELFDTPTAAISLIDSDRPVDQVEAWDEGSFQKIPRSIAFCNSTRCISRPARPLLVNDARVDDSAFRDNPVRDRARTACASILARRS